MGSAGYSGNLSWINKGFKKGNKKTSTLMAVYAGFS